MLISTKGRYAIRTILEFAKRESDERVTLIDVANKQGISEKYLESIIVTLSKAGLVEGVRGRGGGYRLTRKPENYSIGEILRLTEGNLAPVSCLSCEQNTCEKKDECLTLPMWTGLNRVISDYLDNISIADLLNGNVKLQ